MKTSELVSIITPLYNTAQYLEETIRSILSQTFTNFELIVIDDCSTDESLSVAQGLAASDPRIRVHQMAVNSGAAACRNKGTEIARGRYIAFCDSDDLWRHEKLERQLSFMHREAAAVTHTGSEIIDGAGDSTTRTVLPPYRVDYRKMLRANYMQCSTVMYDAGRIGKQYFPGLRKRQDYALWLRILRSIDYAYGLREALVSYRVREGSLSRPLYRNLYYNWTVFHEAEGLGFLRSALCVCSNVLVKLIGKR